MIWLAVVAAAVWALGASRRATSPAQLPLPLLVAVGAVACVVLL